MFEKMCKTLEVFIREVVDYHKQRVIAHSNIVLDDSNVNSVELAQEDLESNKDSVSHRLSSAYALSIFMKLKLKEQWTEFFGGKKY